MTTAITMTPRDKGRISADNPAVAVETGIWRTFAGKLKAVTLALSLGCIMTAAATAGETIKPEEIAGRWSTYGPQGECPADQCKRTFDIVACDNGWCGVEVGEGGKCGRVSMRLTKNEKADESRPFVGTYSAYEGTEPYVIGASFYVMEGKRNVMIYGHTGGVFQPYRRAYPFELDMSREGDAQCKAEPKTS